MDLATLPKELDTLATVRFQDCDPFGHLNNARYVDYFMNARTDQVLEAYNLQIMKAGQTESWVVNKSKPCFLPSGVETTVSTTPRPSMTCLSRYVDKRNKEYMRTAYLAPQNGPSARPGPYGRSCLALYPRL